MVLLIVFHDQRMDSKAICDFKTSLRYRTTQVSGSPGWRLQWNNLPDWLDGAPILKLFRAHPLSLSLSRPMPPRPFSTPANPPRPAKGPRLHQNATKGEHFPLVIPPFMPAMVILCLSLLLRSLHNYNDETSPFTVEKFWFRRVLSYLGKGWWPQKLQTRSEGDSSSFNAIRNCLLKPIWEGGHWRYFKQWVGVQWKGVD